MRNRGRIEVVAGVLENDAGEILLAQRPCDKPMPGRWEFPGGKRRDREAPIDALQRELGEEIDVRADGFRPLIRLHHDYDALSVELDVYRVTAWHGEPRPLEGQSLAWVSVSGLGERNLLEADGPIVAALKLPDRCWVTSCPGDDVNGWFARIETTVGNGLDMLQCRLSRLASAERIGLGRKVRALCRRHGTLFIWNGAPADAERLDADGVHLSAHRLHERLSRPLTGAHWVGASCHSAKDIQRANSLGLDYIFIGTVKPTPSHPGGPTLGWDGFERLASISSVPAYAIGGMTLEDIDRARDTGGQGIAAIRALSRYNSTEGVGSLFR
jgi:8-oxo-dGTP diphosphatase